MHMRVWGGGITTSPFFVKRNPINYKMGAWEVVPVKGIGDWYRKRRKLELKRSHGNNVCNLFVYTQLRNLIIAASREIQFSFLKEASFLSLVRCWCVFSENQIPTVKRFLSVSELRLRPVRRRRQTKASRIWARTEHQVKENSADNIETEQNRNKVKEPYSLREWEICVSI